VIDNNDEKPKSYKLGDETLCAITDRAVDRVVAQLLNNQNKSFEALRIAVIGGGLAGLEYKIQLSEGPKLNDVLINTKNVKLVIDMKSALFVSGSIVDLNPETNDFEVIRVKD